MSRLKSTITFTLNPSIDLSTSVDTVEPTQKLRCKAPSREPGGGGINVSRAMGRLGGSSLAIFPAGGTAGIFLRQLLQDQGVVDHAILTDDLTRESLAVFEESTGEQYRFVFPGPDVNQSEWMRCLAALRSLLPATDIVVASGSLPRGVPSSFYARVAVECRNHDVPLLLDTSGEPLKEALEEGVYFVKPNKRELAELTGRSLHDTRDQEEACTELVQKGSAEVVALTLGAEGAVLAATGEDTIRIATPDVKVESTVGAGDSFVAGFTLGLARGWATREAFLYGVAAGTAAVMTPGSELCSREDTERLYEQLLDHAGS